MMDARRSLRNLRESTRLMALVLLVACAMGRRPWAFLAALDGVTAFRDAHGWPVFLAAARGERRDRLALPHVWRGGRARQQPRDRRRVHRPCDPVAHGALHVRLLGRHPPRRRLGRVAKGTAVQIGGTIADAVSRRFNLEPHDHQDLMMAGIAAAFGGVFGTPLAGAFFGMEMCYVGKLHYAAGVYCLVASFVGDSVATLLGTPREAYIIGRIPELGPETIALAVAAGLVFGVAARLFSGAIRVVRRFYAARHHQLPRGGPCGVARASRRLRRLRSLALRGALGHGSWRRASRVGPRPWTLFASWS